MIFKTIETRNGYTHLDGYSKAKTIKGAIKDLSKEVAKINEDEGNTIVEYIEDVLNYIADKNETHDGYFIEAEKVENATRYIDDNTNEYRDAEWYLHICFVA